jgi:hypothetical protein
MHPRFGSRPRFVVGSIVVLALSYPARSDGRGGGHGGSHGGGGHHHSASGYSGGGARFTNGPGRGYGLTPNIGPVSSLDPFNPADLPLNRVHRLLDRMLGRPDRW